MKRWIKNILLFLILIKLSISIGQSNRSYETNPDRKRTFNWLFGDSIWLDYKTNPPSFKSGSRLKVLESASSYSDTAGNLLLYTDGVKLWNNKHILLANNLTGNPSSSMGSIFVKHPANDSIVFLFTTDYQCNNKGLRYSLIKLLKGGDSVIFLKKNILLITPVCESIAVTSHKNRLFSWITVHSSSGNTFYSFLINQNGIVFCPVISNSGYNFDGQALNCQSDISISSDNKKIAITVFSDFKVLLLDFNDETGVINNDLQFNSILIPTGLLFSNSSNYLYIKERDRNLLQYDIKGNSFKTIYTSINNESIVGIRNTPYKSIYFNMPDSFKGSLLINPDSAGASLKYKRNGIILNKRATYGLPHFNQSYFYTPSIDFSYNYDCIGNILTFDGRDTFYATQHRWEIRKIGKGIEAIYISKKANHIFKDTGIYKVSYIASQGTRKDTIIKRISIYPKVSRNFLGRDTAYETGTNFTKQLKVPFGTYCQLWLNDSSKLGSFNVDTKGIFISKATNQAFCEVIDTIIITDCINSLAIPSIYRSRDTLYSNHQLADSFVWYRNNVKYTITKAPFLKLTDSGTYRVEAARKNYCNRSSSAFNVNQLKINAVNLQNEGITLYPNPTNGKIFINSERDFKLLVTDIAGKVIIDTENVAEVTLPKGVYLFRFLVNQALFFEKVIVW